VPLSNDPTAEPSETLTLTVRDPANAILGTPSSTTLSIQDDDPPPTVAWQSASFRVAESAGSGLVTVLLSAPSSYTVTVPYATSDGTATAGSDYTAASGTLTFVPGETARSIAVPITTDTASEGAETVQLTLSSPTNATLGSPSGATLTIEDDDGAPPPSEERYTYDRLGNLTSTTGVGAYAYGANGDGTGAGPHQARSVGGQAYTYDANGNLVSGGGRTYQWDAENRPTRIVSGTLSEDYTYDADGERLTRTVNGVTTVELAGLWAEVVGGATKVYYPFHGTIVAMRQGGTVTAVHGDHLGSVSVATTSGGLLSQQAFAPWGKVRSGGISQTTLNYTGQRLDGTGLLYYHARYYDPGLGRFISADSVVPGAGPLTAWPHDAPAQAAGAAGGGGPGDPQALNRYSYARNNPLRYTDPTGHCVVTLHTGIQGCIPVSLQFALWAAGPGLAANAAANQMPRSTPPPRSGVLTSWLVEQMSVNANAAVTGSIRSALGRGPINAALGLNAWKTLVRTDGVWDFKKDIRAARAFTDEATQDVQLGNQQLNFQAVANIHYGFVGRAAGIDRQVLYAGAGFAQWREHGTCEAYLCDQAFDHWAVRFGVVLFEKYGADGLTDDILTAELDNYVATNPPPPLP
jgi:RHS repeat-associated protein